MVVREIAEDNHTLCVTLFFFLTTESLILAQNERWRRGSGMQVVRERVAIPEYSGEWVSNAWGTCLQVGDNTPNGVLIPNVIARAHVLVIKDGLCLQAIA